MFRRATLLRPEGDSPLSLHATVLSSRVVLSFVSRHRAGVRATSKEEEEEESLFKADAVNEEDSERDRAEEEEEGLFKANAVN